MAVVERLLRTYRLEPAGSHGVWGLDDYHFLNFLWGSAQLLGHRNIKPKSILLPDIVEGYWRDYLYLGGIHAINEVRKIVS